jgi:hypothetical protein
LNSWPLAIGKTGRQLFPLAKEASTLCASGRKGTNFRLTVNGPEPFGSKTHVDSKSGDRVPDPDATAPRMGLPQHLRLA